MACVVFVVVLFVVVVVVVVVVKTIKKTSVMFPAAQLFDKWHLLFCCV